MESQYSTQVGNRLPNIDNAGAVRGGIGHPSRCGRAIGSSIEDDLLSAREFEARELAYWQAVLAYEPAYEVVRRAWSAQSQRCDLDVVDQLNALVLARSNPETWARVLNDVAARFRAADLDRCGLNGTFSALAAWPDARREYIATVRRAWSSQQQLKNEIVSAHLRLVAVIARRTRVEHLSCDDLVQEGTLGLIKAVERFDYRLGFRFSTYASWWIRHAIKRAVADTGRTVRIPVHMTEVRSVVYRTKQRLLALAGEAPTTDRLASATGIPAAKVELAERVPETRLSLDAPVSGTDGSSFKDQLENPSTCDPLDNISLCAWLEQLPNWLDVLTPMEYQILRWRFGLDDCQEMTLQEIGERYGYSRERVRQLEERALDKIRSRITDCYGVAAEPDEC